MAKTSSDTQARERAAEINKEYIDRAQTAANPTGTPLAELQAELDAKLSAEGGEHVDFLRESLSSFARDTHNHRLDAKQALANAAKFIDAYMSTEAEVAQVEEVALEAAPEAAAKAKK